VGALGTLTARHAYGQTSLTLLPRVGFGATNNPTGLVGQEHWDEMLLAGVNAQVDYAGAIATQGLGYRISYTRFLQTGQADTLSNALAYTSTYHLGAAWTLGLSADAIVTRTSQVATIADLTPAAPPQAAVGGATLYFTTAVGETLAFAPKPTQTYREALRLQYLEYLQAPGSPTTLSGIGTVAADWTRGLNVYSAETGLLGSWTTASESGSVAPVTPASDAVAVQIAAIWRRQLSAAWTSVLRGGGAVVVTRGDTSLEPLGLASLEFQRDRWFATLTAGQQAAPNLFTGGLTLNDSVVLQGAVPLDPRELVILAGHAGYAHARPVGQQGALAFDQWLAAIAMNGHLPRLPLWAAVEYTLIDQTNNASMTNTTMTPVQDLLRHTVMISIGGAFRWGGAGPAGGGAL
jgi:hypothetical protein